MALNHGLYIQRKEKYLNQLSAVIDFLNLKDTCRSVFLMQYFGEKTNRSCGQCDICLSKKENSNKDIYIEIRKNILEKMDKNIFFDLEFIKKINPKMDIKLIRKVIDRMLEISELEKGVGETFRKII
jgi:ATP-dependent DNA helicase RecQ